jgi:HAD superfamily hydrolase (TIGR01509 family)
MPAAAALFDVDGTLVDSVDLHARAWQEAFAHFGKRIALEEIRAQIGKGGDQLLPVFFSQDELARRGQAIEAYRSDLYKRKYLKRVRPFPRVRELFEALRRRGVRIGLASSAKGDELEMYERMLHIEDLVEAETSADDAARSKPYPDIFQAAMKRLGSPDPRRTLAVGDSPWDAMAAGRIGVRTIGVLCGGFPEEELRKAGCIAIYRDPADLLERLDESPFMQ